MQSSIEVVPVTGTVGAEIRGIDLANTLSNEEIDTIHQAFLDHGVIFFREQSWQPDQQIAFARRFGEIDHHPIVNGMEEFPEIVRIHKVAGESATFGVGWHSDHSFSPEPSMASIVHGIKVPPYGGDTVFANQRIAYERLSDGMKRMLEGMNAVHSAGPAFTADTTKDKWEGKSKLSYRPSETLHEEQLHPVVRTHPETGAKALYVNPMFTLRFEDMTEEESRPLLEYLYAHGTRSEFCCRFKWERNSVAMWDNRTVQHNAMDDYQQFERILHRVVIKGDRPH